MRALFSSAKWIAVHDDIVRYHGPPGLVAPELLKATLSSLTVAKPLFSWLPSGGVYRNLEDALGWAEWICNHRHSQFERDPVENCRFFLLLLAEPHDANMNLLFRITPIHQDGSVGYRSIVRRTGDDEFACFE